MRSKFIKHGYRYDQYNLISAVRGPDFSEDPCGKLLKRVVVERIRAIVFKAEECLGDYNSLTLTEQEFDELKKSFMPLSDLSRKISLKHFADHLRRAVESSVEHPIWNGLGEELLSFLSYISA